MMLAVGKTPAGAPGHAVRERPREHGGRNSVVAHAAAGTGDGWTVQFIRSDGETLHGGFGSRADAEYHGQCLWAGPQGRGVTGVYIREHAQGAWLPVLPASVCGATRL